MPISPDSLKASPFQTNILALNAAVEAARAGEQGNQAAAIRQQEFEAVLADIRAKMAAYGYTPQDIFGRSRGRPRLSRGASTAKYRDPASGATWSGKLLVILNVWQILSRAVEGWQAVDSRLPGWLRQFEAERLGAMKLSSPPFPQSARRRQGSCRTGKGAPCGWA